MGCDTEARITAVERAQEYADLTPEAPAIVEGYRPPKVLYGRDRCCCHRRDDEAAMMPRCAARGGFGPA